MVLDNTTNGCPLKSVAAFHKTTGFGGGGLGGDIKK